jgi:hypothetical protein
LGKAITSRRREELKKHAAERQKVEDEERKQLAAQSAVEKKKVLKMKDAAAFSLSFNSDEQMPTVSFEDFKSTEGRQPVWAAPCIVRGWAEVGRKLLPTAADDAETTATAMGSDGDGAQTNNILQQAVDRWHASFNKHALCVRDDRVSAPLYDAHGRPVADEVFERILSQMTTHSCEELPVMARPLKQPWLFGYNPNLVTFGCEPEHLATLRAVTMGQLHVLSASPADIARASGMHGGSLTQMLHYMRAMTKAQLEEVRANKCRVYSGLAARGDIIFGPAGYIVACTPANNSSVAGIRRSLLPCYDDGALDAEQLQRLNVIRGALRAERGGKDEDPAPASHLVVSVPGCQATP